MDIPSGKLTVCELENPPIFKFGKSTISIRAIFNSYAINPSANARFMALGLP